MKLSRLTFVSDETLKFCVFLSKEVRERPSGYSATRIVATNDVVSTHRYGALQAQERYMLKRLHSSTKEQFSNRNDGSRRVHRLEPLVEADALLRPQYLHPPSI